jgi:hypothetical protein
MTTAWLLTSLLALAPSAFAQIDATEDDLAKLQADLQNLEADLGLVAADALSPSQRERVERIREEAIYLNVKARKHQEGMGSEGAESTGIPRDEVRSRLDISDLRKTSASSQPRRRRGSVTIPAGTGSAATRRIAELGDGAAGRPIHGDGRGTRPSGNRVAIEAEPPSETVSRRPPAGARTARQDSFWSSTRSSITGRPYECRDQNRCIGGSRLVSAPRPKIGRGGPRRSWGDPRWEEGAVIKPRWEPARFWGRKERVELPHGTILKLRLDNDLSLSENAQNPRPSSSRSRNLWPIRARRSAR